MIVRRHHSRIKLVCGIQVKAFGTNPGNSNSSSLSISPSLMLGVTSDSCLTSGFKSNWTVVSDLVVAGLVSTDIFPLI